MAETPDDQNLTKRQRQKQRRHQKLEQQRAAQRASRRKRTIASVTIIAVLVGLVGAFTFGWVSDRVEERRLIAAAEESLDELGCTPVTEEPILPSQHLSGDELAGNPPEVIYQVRPATSGRHIGGIVRTGVYDKLIDERMLVHNLEHGYVNFFYDQDAPEDQVEELKAFAREQISSRRNEKVIVAPWKAGLPDDANFAIVAWGVRQHCRDFDEGVALNFLREHHYLAGNAPEKELRPHLDEGVDPDEEEGDLLFPPLSEEEPPDETLEELEDDAGHDDEATDEDTEG